jgi:hypothetical protein
LPLDIFAQRVYLPGDPCAPSTGADSSSAQEDPFAGCTDIVGIDILDPTDNHAIGTVYTSRKAI